MKPIRTPETNTTFNPAEGDEERVLPLPTTVRSEDEVPGIYSTWELSPEERAQIAEGAHIEIGMAAVKPPPVGLAVVAPFTEEGDRMVWSDELKTFVCPTTEE